MNKLINWSKRQYSFNQRFLATISAGIIFLFLIPLLITRGMSEVDKFIGLPSLKFGFASLFVGGFMVIVGAFYALWSIISQLTRAKGTPLPMMATQKLLIDGPFRHSRNPMGFGAICMYFGMAIIVGSISSIIVIGFFLFLLVLWIKKVEEKEMEIRFGQEYVNYKNTTPFMIPKPRRK